MAELGTANHADLELLGIAKGAAEVIIAALEGKGDLIFQCLEHVWYRLCGILQLGGLCKRYHPLL